MSIILPNRISKDVQENLDYILVVLLISLVIEID